MENKIFKVAILGAESTGKTTLCEQLSSYYKTVFVDEFARSYIEDLKRPYTLDDIIYITKKHLENENQALTNANKILFVDTELIITKIWAEDKFNSVPDFINNHLQEQKYDLYLLTANDIPWQEDAVRENPNRRDYLQALYIKELEKINANYKIVSGLGVERLGNAIKLIEENGFGAEV